ncbi:MAG: hypothetical protein KF780_12475 [Sphingomonas sp.]|nr:hypothetical protein [Sphingomonas sp.]
MRIERTGKVEPLTPQVIRFLTQALGGVSLDDSQSPEAMRIDYSCMRGLLAVELKTFEEPGTERLDNLADQLRARDDWPMFLGSAPMQSFIKNMDDPEGVQRRVLDRIGRGIINHLKKANRQLEAHRRGFPRRNMVRLLLLVNEDHEIYDPHTVSYILWHAVRRRDGDRALYEHVDGIMFLTQRHATVRSGKLTYPIVTIEGMGCHDHPWKGDVLDLVARRWATRNGYDEVESGSVEEFTTIDHIPEVAPRHERWRTEYKRRPYLSRLSKEELRDRFDEVAVLSALSMLKNSPLRLTQEQGLSVIRQFGDFMQELGDRGIPITEFQQTDEREAAAARRLGLPKNVIDWLASMKRR